MIDVSVVMAACNARQWIRDAIDSALAQDRVSVEVIVIDDGSTDGTSEMLAAYGSKVTCVSQRNQGLAAARNRGLELATGKYVQFLDADDILLPHKLEQQVAALRANPDASVVYGDFEYCNEDASARSRPRGMRRRTGSIWSDLVRDNFIVVHAALARLVAVRDAGGFDESLEACEDYDLWLRLSECEMKFLYKPGVGVLYRRRAGSMSSDRSRQIAATMRVLEKAMQRNASSPTAVRECRKRIRELQDLLALSQFRDSIAAVVSGRVRAAAARSSGTGSDRFVVTPARAARILAMTGRRVGNWLYDATLGAQPGRAE